jgi:hypothetical protein
VGRMTFSLKKAEAPSKWARLLKGKEKKNQMHVWWEMADKYRPELEKIDEEETTKSKKSKAEAESSATSVEVGASGEVAAESVAGKTETATPVKDKASSDLSEALKKVDSDAKKEIKAINDEGRKKKEEIDSELKAAKLKLDAKAKLDKKEIDTEILSKREAVEYKANKLKKEIQTNATAAAANDGSPLGPLDW